MAKEEMLEMEGTVQEVLPNTQFRVALENGAVVLAYAGGKVRQNRIRILAGDRVTLEMSTYDITRGRINYRHKDEHPVRMAPRRPARGTPGSCCRRRPCRRACARARAAPAAVAAAPRP